jgi:hypothetical protein
VTACHNCRTESGYSDVVLDISYATTKFRRQSALSFRALFLVKTGRQSPAKGSKT